MIAYQALIRRQHAKEHPRPRLASLDHCTVVEIRHAEAKPLIEKFEWLGTMANRTAACYGLRAPDGELLGAVVFAHPYNQRALDICGPTYRRSVICLARGACVHFAPLNAASFLISRAVKLAALAHGWRIVTAYADESAGERGTIYTALGWRYLGQGVGHGRNRMEWKRPGTSKWISSRNLHRDFKGKGGWARARKAGWESRSVPSRHKYVLFTGRDAEKLEALALARLGLTEWSKAPRRPSHNRARTRRRQKVRRGLLCAVCKVTLSATRRHARYCSGRCRVRAHRLRAA